MYCVAFLGAELFTACGTFCGSFSGQPIDDNFLFKSTRFSLYSIIKVQNQPKGRKYEIETKVAR